MAHLDRIQFQFSTTDHPISGLIRVFTHSEFSHVDAVIMPGFPTLENLTPNPYGLLGASNPGYPDPGGVQLRAPNYHKMIKRRRITLMTDKADKIVELLASQIGKEFDEEALVRALDTNPRNWRLKNKWFCAELVLWALEEAGFFPYPLVGTKNRVTPGDLLLILNPYYDPVELGREVAIND